MKHSDCKNFTPVDAFKGLCRANGGMVMIDSDTCPQFAAAPKCRNCVHFCDPNEEEIGICKGLEKEYWAYADLNAKTCEGYQAKE